MTITVSQLNKYIFYLVKEDEKLKKIRVCGEISNFSRNARSGHCYFTLKDSESCIRAVMFAGYAGGLDFVPANGMSVTVYADVTVYERDGVYQLMVTAMQKDGAGTLSAAFEQLRDRLEAQGLFDEAHKRSLPALPRKIGVVTSRTGAALHDIINIISRRYPICELEVFPATVQGDTAPASICEGIRAAQERQCSLVIVGRGGGSLEDLSCFNAESVVRAVYDCEIPVISAVGHETDFTLCDFAADLRAPTPSAAAELAAPDISSLIANLDALRERAENGFDSVYEKKSEQLSAITQRLDFLSPAKKFDRMAQTLDELSSNLSLTMEKYVAHAEESVASYALLLESLSPLRVLSRGYCAAYSQGRLISSAEKISAGDSVEIRFSDGKIHSTVDFVEKI